jgi:hypothetical protein
MSAPPEGEVIEGGSQLPWYIYDRDAELMHVAANLAEAGAWAFLYWDVLEVGDREEVAENDYFYLLLARRRESFRSRDFQARILRRDRVTAIGYDPEAIPRHPAG